MAGVVVALGGSAATPLAPAAPASEIRAATSPPLGRNSDPIVTLTLTGTPSNDAVTVTPDGDALHVTDTAGLQVGEGCATVDATRARCPLGNLEARLADDDDVMQVSAQVNAQLHGEGGDDDLRGGPAPGANVLTGGAGDDVLDGGLPRAIA